MRTNPPRLALLALSACLLTGCAVGPAYHTPTTPQPPAFKEAQGWVPAAPADTLERGPWWTLFQDPVLNQLEADVDVSNQNVAAAVAAYDQARALVRQQRASLFPSVNLNTSATRVGGERQGGSSTRYNLDIGGNWELDVWGRLRSSVTAASANAQATEADLASARLSAQGELAADYFSLRAVDAAIVILATTTTGYQRAVEITQNRFNAGIAAHSDLLQAQTQLANAQADMQGLIRQRAQLEHAIAVLAGKTPAEFSLAPLPAWQVVVPEVPAGVPSTLLQRRPDIAAAERRVAAANAQIGVARSAYFPSLGLSASYGTAGGSFANLFNASNAAWSFGLSAAQSVFNAGAISASVESAEAAHRATVARYRQTVLNAFADVEDQLAVSRVLATQQDLRRQASTAADQVEQQMENRYKAGQVSYTDVITAQVTALQARRNLVQVQADRQSAAVSLIQALGGGWHVPQ